MPHVRQASNSSIMMQVADKSARRKGTRRIFHPINNEDSDSDSDRIISNGTLRDEGDEENHDEDADEDEDEDEDEIAEDDEDDSDEARQPSRQHQDRPSKRQPHRRKKPRTSGPDEQPTNLPPHERYFWDNRAGASKTSDHTLPPNLLLNHDEYFAQRAGWQDAHAVNRGSLLDLHKGTFAQWAFELRSDFNVCLYGYGSKRAALAAFAEFLASQEGPDESDASILVVNGYRDDINLTDILTCLASTLFPSHIKLPKEPASLLQLVLDTLTAKPPMSPIYILIHSIDSPALRRGLTAQSALADLAANPSIRLAATADMPNFLQLWDASLRTRYHFLFHDCTTFEPYNAEIDAVVSVNELLGRSGRRLGGRDGVGYVLRSLPENARSLFSILVAELVALAADGEDESTGIQYRVLYQKAKEELVVSSEHQLNNLLKEFYDHQMVESKKDAMGVEYVHVPFRKEELESLLEELV